MKELEERGIWENLADLRGKIRFEEGYDYKSMRNDRKIKLLEGRKMPRVPTTPPKS